MKRGKYIVVEGGDGVGKTTVITLLAGRLRRELGHEVILVEEPDSAHNADGTVLVPIATELRRIIKAKEYNRSSLTNVLLFTAARRENWLQAIKPALERGAWVLSARNYYSTIVYQGYAEAWGIADLIQSITEHATHKLYTEPDHAFILDLDEASRVERLRGRGSRIDLDTFEAMPQAFQDRVNEGYRRLADERGLPLISAIASPEEIAETIWQKIMQPPARHSKTLT